MFTALFSFLGGSAFRMIWGQIAGYIDKRQDHQNELDHMRLQGDLDQARHTLDCERLRLQAELGVKEVVVQADADVSRMEAQAFVEAMKTANAKTGISWVDAWNGVIRPLAASIAIFLWVLALHQAGYKMGDWDKELVGVVLGFFFASRVLTRDRGAKQ